MEVIAQKNDDNHPSSKCFLIMEYYFMEICYAPIDFKLLKTKPCYTVKFVMKNKP